MKKYNASKHRAGRGGYVNQSFGITDEAEKSTMSEKVNYGVRLISKC